MFLENIRQELGCLGPRIRLVKWANWYGCQLRIKLVLIRYLYFPYHCVGLSTNK